MSDYIKREEALEKIAFVNEQISREKDIERIIGAGAYLLNLGAKEAISSIAAADVRENVHAHWVEMPPYTHHQPKDFECSACHESEIRKTRFCPNCGAIMDEEVNK